MTDHAKKCFRAIENAMLASQELREALEYEGTSFTARASLSEAMRHLRAAFSQAHRAYRALEPEISAPPIQLHPSSKPRGPLNFDPSTALVGGLLMQSLKAKQQ